jgi:hypothetical protein
MQYDSPDKIAELSTLKLLAYKSMLEKCVQRHDKWQETYEACLKVLSRRKRPQRKPRKKFRKGL